MWMMGYNDGAEFNIHDSCNGRKLRPLIPRPVPSTNNTSASSPPCLSRLHGPDFFAVNHHLATIADQGKRDFNTEPAVVVSSRWNPTPEQLRTLEELYRRGTRTPSAEQIQHITVQLRRYGKIEGKNVFYWFQNHKARERQKRRRQMESAACDDIELFERKESEVSRTGYEGEQTKNWLPSTNYSTLSEESVSIRAAKAAAMAEFIPDGWIQLEEGELQPRTSFIEKNATWQTMQLSCPSPTHLINTTTSTSATSTTIATTTTTTPATIRTMDQMQLIKATTHDVNIFIAPYRENGGHGFINQFNHNVINEDDHGFGESQTLQLFPLRSCGRGGGRGGEDSENSNEKETEVSSVAAAMNGNNLRCQFFEFLPLKD